MSVILRDLLLFCCLAAFYTGIVLAAASLLNSGGSAPGPRTGECKTGGAHSPFLVLLVVARMSLGLSGAWAGHTLTQR